MKRGCKEEAAQRRFQGACGDGGTLRGEDPGGAVGGIWSSSDDDSAAGKQELVKRAGELFARGNKAPAVDDAQKVIDDLHRKIGQLQVERDFLAGQPAISRVLRGGR